MNPEGEDWKLTRSSEDPADVRAWQRERNVAGVMYLTMLVVWLIAIVEAIVFSIEVGQEYGLVAGGSFFVALFVVELVFFFWLARDIVFKRGR